MDDLISRQAAIEALGEEPEVWDEWTDEYQLGRRAEWRSSVNAIKAVRFAPRWIPVSERLPEDEGWYVVTDDSGGVRWLEVEHYDPESGLEPFCTIQNPVAWMPLPEPYREETEDVGKSDMDDNR